MSVVQVRRHRTSRHGGPLAEAAFVFTLIPLAKNSQIIESKLHRDHYYFLIHTSTLVLTIAKYMFMRINLKLIEISAFTNT